MQGIKLHSNKRLNDFDVLVWPNMKNMQDHRGIKITKTGYEIDDETAEDLEEHEENEDQRRLA